MTQRNVRRSPFAAVRGASLITFAGILLVGAALSDVIDYVERRIAGAAAGVTVEGVSVERLFEREVRERVEELAYAAEKMPQSAEFDKRTGEIVPEVAGVWIDVDETVGAVMEAGAGEPVSLARVGVLPELRAEELQALTETLGRYATWISGSAGRARNIELAAKAIDWTVVRPGETFSFNERVGPRTPEKGYEHAPIIVGELFVPGVGGGICQVSTTLYNAVQRAGLEVTVRHPHSISPSYVPEGMDATVNWPDLDFAFRNDRSRPVLLRAAVDGWRLEVTVIGAPESGGAAPAGAGR